ncbi:MAG: hypothetical protein GF334_01240 [Candidatus Altiarchaeales archaeon]|nr:hypothetical protein [Candidatus Altiarchaeales archaeon]
MIEATITVDDKDTQQFLDYLKGRWQLIVHNEMDEWGDELQSLAREFSPEDKLRGIDKRRRPAKERLALSWGFDLRTEREQSRLELYTTDERAHLILFPTSGKEGVTPKGEGPMIFFNEDGSGPFRAWSINKPPTPGQPVHQWALQEFGIDGKVLRLGRKLAKGV